MTNAQRGPYRTSDRKPEPQPCPAAVVVGDSTVHCKRAQAHPMWPHDRHEYRRRGDGYEIVVTWLEIIDKPPKPKRVVTSLTTIRRCGYCGQPGHYKRTCSEAGR